MKVDDRIKLMYRLLIASQVVQDLMVNNAAKSAVLNAIDNIKTDLVRHEVSER